MPARVHWLDACGVKHSFHTKLEILLVPFRSLFNAHCIQLSLPHPPQ